MLTVPGAHSKVFSLACRNVMWLWPFSNYISEIVQVCLLKTEIKSVWWWEAAFIDFFNSVLMDMTIDMHSRDLTSAFLSVALWKMFFSLQHLWRNLSKSDLDENDVKLTWFASINSFQFGLTVTMPITTQPLFFHCWIVPSDAVTQNGSFS